MKKFFRRNKTGLVMIAAASIILAGMSVATLAFASEPEEPAEPIPEHTPVVWIEAEPWEAPPVFELSAEERRTVECIVMGEAGGESYEGKVLVAQCILNACEKDGIQPSEVRIRYQYSGWNESPSEEVREAVAAVFDDGYTLTDEPILYFYAPAYCNGAWHETQRHVLTEGGHKFFAEY